MIVDLADRKDGFLIADPYGRTADRLRFGVDRSWAVGMLVLHPRSGHRSGERRCVALQFRAGIAPTNIRQAEPNGRPSGSQGWLNGWGDCAAAQLGVKRALQPVT